MIDAAVRPAASVRSTTRSPVSIVTVRTLGPTGRDRNEVVVAEVPTVAASAGTAVSAAARAVTVSTDSAPVWACVRRGDDMWVPPEE